MTETAVDLFSSTTDVGPQVLTWLDVCPSLQSSQLIVKSISRSTCVSSTIQICLFPIRQIPTKSTDLANLATAAAGYCPQILALSKFVRVQLTSMQLHSQWCTLTIFQESNISYIHSLHSLSTCFEQASNLNLSATRSAISVEISMSYFLWDLSFAIACKLWSQWKWLHQAACTVEFIADNTIIMKCCCTGCCFSDLAQEISWPSSIWPQDTVTHHMCCCTLHTKFFAEGVLDQADQNLKCVIHHDHRCKV